jgi:hypothetical protein
VFGFFYASAPARRLIWVEVSDVDRPKKLPGMGAKSTEPLPPHFGSLGLALKPSPFP